MMDQEAVVVDVQVNKPCRDNDARAKVSRKEVGVQWYSQPFDTPGCNREECRDRGYELECGWSDFT